MLKLAANHRVVAQNAGYFLSRGRGRHARRIIDSHELIFVVQGRLQVQEADTAFAVQPNEALVLIPGREHWGIEDYDSDLRFFWIHFNMDAKDCENSAALGASLTVPQHSTPSDPARLAQLYRWFLDAQETHTLHPREANLLMLLMLFVVSRSGSPEHMRTGQLPLAEQAMRLIKTKFTEDVSTREIARILQCNADYLGRLFKQCYGHTIIETVHYYRLKQAKWDLMDSSKTIREISWDAGFRDDNYFRRVFKKHEGIGPSTYRSVYAHMHVNTF
jgi:AraC-like DNA-binding protein